jgi:hypothetical protein
LRRRVLAEQVEAKTLARQPGRGQDRLDDIGRVLVLEDAAVVAVLQPPDPRHQLGLVELEMARLADILERGDHTRDEARRLEPVDLEHAGRVDDGGEVDLAAGELEVKLEQTRQALAAEETHDPQLSARRSLECEERLVAEERAEKRHQAHEGSSWAYANTIVPAPQAPT